MAENMTSPQLGILHLSVPENMTSPQLGILHLSVHTFYLHDARLLQTGMPTIPDF